MRSNPPLTGLQVEIADDHLTVASKTPLLVLSSAVLNGGLRRANNILIKRVRENLRCRDPQAYLSKAAAMLHLEPAMTIGFMTAADPRNLGFSNFGSANVKVSAIVTAGTSNAAKAGERVRTSKSEIGTVNTIVLTNAKIADGCFVNALQTATEAKALAFRELDIRSSNSGEEATCTSSDSTLVGSTGEGIECAYAGVATDLGRLIAKAVNQAVKEAIIKQDRLLPHRGLLDRLRERGITLEDLEDAFLEMYIHHKTMGTRKGVRKTFRKLLEEAASDHNVAALVMAALRLEDDGRLGLIPGLSEAAFARDPVSLLADEIVGTAISNYVAGSKGLFEYVRFDQKKPGIVRKLGPFADDAIGALVAGTSSNVYSKLLRQR